MDQIRVTLHRWRLDLPDVEVVVDRVGGVAPEEIVHQGATYRVIHGDPHYPTYSLEQLPEQTKPRRA
ncbi:MAG TPA: hypothetical protein VGH76_19710 [Actinomycetospora sp.]|jgi:hypothetical protein|uniref:hypothetical protein n=1 Tax=Actinomycetospora sp. TaxID=1872135 RepID=UPI002F4249AE